MGPRKDHKWASACVGGRLTHFLGPKKRFQRLPLAELISFRRKQPLAPASRPASPPLPHFLHRVTTHPAMILPCTGHYPLFCKEAVGFERQFALAGLLRRSRSQSQRKRFAGPLSTLKQCSPPNAPYRDSRPSPVGPRLPTPPPFSCLLMQTPCCISSWISCFFRPMLNMARSSNLRTFLPR